jgi:hypothetical protein
MPPHCAVGGRTLRRSTASVKTSIKRADPMAAFQWKSRDAKENSGSNALKSCRRSAIK